MKIQKLTTLSKEQKQKILKRSTESFTDINDKVKEIIDNVKKKGDAALKEYTEKFDKVKLSKIQVSQTEINTAYKKVNQDFLKAIKQMKKNIKTFSKSQLEKKEKRVVETEKGIKVWAEWRPIEKVGLYVPGGKALYPSTVLMTAIPATIAGCKEIIMVSPPQKNGKITPEVLVTAAESGITKIFKIGGAQAIAALAYGTKTIPNVDKIFGPGNIFVTAAKQLVMNEVAIDMPAGPSEVMIIADETANPTYIATDLMADAEHSGDNGCILLTTSDKIAQQTIEKIKELIINLPTKKTIEQSLENYGLIATSKNIDEITEFANEYAPEHLQIMTKENKQVLKKIKNAGSVFLGTWTSKSSGDYATGANHVLPTGGLAKSYSALNIEAFGKWMEVQECTKKGLESIKETICLISNVEHLPAHKLSTEIRFT